MNLINDNINSVKAFAPATCANIAVGFDILGFSFGDIGDYVTLIKRNDNKIMVESIEANEKLPLDSQKNTASVVIKKICEDLKLEIGFSIHIQKGIPLSSGMGGSAASAVAALVAFNAFLNTPLKAEKLVHYALYGEEVASGQRHADNIVPCIFGGLTLIHSLDPIEVVELPIPKIHCALIHPHLRVKTRDARNILRTEVSLQRHVRQSANLASFIAALYQQDNKLIKKSLADHVIEPQRAKFVPGFYDIKQSALQAGALGVSFSGSGPSLFAWANSAEEAVNISDAMRGQLSKQNIHSDQWIASITKQAAQVVGMS